MLNCSMQLIDFPTELLVIIMNELNNVELVYSLMGINQRLDNILYDFMVTRCLRLIICSSNGQIYPLADEILDKFCLKILPKIHDKIKSITVELLSMKRIFLIGDYSNLRELGLVSIEWERFLSLFNEKNSLIKKIGNQISIVSLSLDQNGNQITNTNITKSVFENIFNIFPQIIDLKLIQLSTLDVRRLSFGHEIPIFSCSTLKKLHINVDSLTDCLILLDGRLNELCYLYIDIELILRISPKIDMKKKLNNLKYFSLSSKFETYFYKESIVPLLHRMLNLERLVLSLVTEQEDKFLDGNCLNNDIINFMPKLKYFSFNILSLIYFNNEQISIPSNEDIQHTFKNFSNKKIISCVDYFPRKNIGQCHFYSYPYRIKTYYNITNHFPSGLFKFVDKISLFDERPFQHEFFIKISQSFPFIKELTVKNYLPQNSNLYNNNNNQELSIIKYPYLNKLNLIKVHHDYIEQFLFHSKTFLSNSIYLLVKYDSLIKATNYFRRDQTKINSAKIKHLSLYYRQEQLPEHFYQYFPYLKSLH